MEKCKTFLKKPFSAKRLQIFTIIFFIVLSAYTVCLILPFIWALLQTFRSGIDFAIEGPLKFGGFNFENYKIIFDIFKTSVEMPDGSRGVVYIEEMYLNTFIYVLSSSIAQIVACIFVAYATARFPFKFSKFIYAMVLIVMALPVVGSFPSEITVARTLGLYNTRFMPFVMKFTFLGIYYFVLYEAFRAIPNDFAESAFIDGANNLQVMVKIMLPMVRNILFTIFVILFVQYWNDYQTPILYMYSYPTLSSGLLMLPYENGVAAQVPVQLTASFFVFVPVLLLFIVFHERFLTNITLGGIKE